MGIVVVVAWVGALAIGLFAGGLIRVSGAEPVLSAWGVARAITWPFVAWYGVRWGAGDQVGALVLFACALPAAVLVESAAFVVRTLP